jgi:hypothetical protein
MKALAAVAVSVVVVAALRVILGPVLATLVVGPALWIAILVGWSLAERKLFPDPPPTIWRPGPVVDVGSRPAGSLDR